MLARHDTDIPKVFHATSSRNYGPVCPLCGNAVLADATYNHDLAIVMTPDGSAAFSPRQAAVFRALWLARGRVVSHAALQEALRRVVDGDHLAAQTISAIRKRIRPLGMQIEAVPLEGYRLQTLVRPQVCEG